jgi:hypothetical protein
MAPKADVAMADEEAVVPREEEAALAAAREALLRFFREERPKSLFYLGQLEVLFEDRPIIDSQRGGKKGPFHWITSKAVSQLAAEGRIVSEMQPQSPGGAPHGLRFFHAKGYRDWRKEAKQIQQLVAEFSEPAFTQGLGHHLELLVDSALASNGFRVAETEVTAWEGRKWTATGENLSGRSERGTP